MLKTLIEEMNVTSQVVDFGIVRDKGTELETVFN